MRETKCQKILADNWCMIVTFMLQRQVVEKYWYIFKVTNGSQMTEVAHSRSLPTNFNGTSIV